MLEKLTLKIMRKVRAEIYRFGFRPKRGSIFNSPSLDMYWASRDAMKGFKND